MKTIETTAATFTAPASAPARRYDIPKLEPRRRADEHPMAMFGIIVATAFASMAFLPGHGPAAAAVQPAPIVEQPAADRSDRLPETEIDRACRGQAWGAETLECLVMIARESTGEQRRIRLVVADQTNSTTPNIF